MKNPTPTPSFAQTLLAQTRGFYQGLEPSHRRMLAGATAATLLGLACVGVWAGRVPYSTLVSGRSHDDLMSAMAALEAAEIPHRLGDDNASLEVPTGSLGRARMIVDQDSSSDGVDLEYMQVGYTHQQQQWAFLRSREIELARMINELEPVEKSRVSIVPEEQSLFVDEKRPASATVFVKLLPGARLGGEQVRSITNMVASSVEGLTADRVTLTDHRGRLYNGGDAENTGDLNAPTLLEQRRKLQRDYENKLRESLLQVLRTPADFNVGVAVELDHSSAEIRSRQIDGDGAVPVSEEINEATTEKTDAGGAPGVDANLPERTEAGGAGSTGTQSSEKLRNRVNYDFPTVEKTEVRAPGDIARVSVAVVINQARVQAILAEFGDGAPTVEEFQQQIRESVQAAVGYDQARGDVVSVNFTPFATLELVEDTPAFAAAELGSYLPHALAALAMLLTFVMVVRPLIQKITSVEINRDEEDDDDEVRARQMAEDRNLAERLRDLVDNFEPVDADDLNRLVDHQSDAAAQVLRDWAHNKKAG